MGSVQHPRLPAATAFLLAGVLFSSGCHTTGMAVAPPPPPPPDVPRELAKVVAPPYVVEPPDVLLIEAVLTGKNPTDPPVPLNPQPVSGQFLVRPDGSIGLGVYGSLQVTGLTLDQVKQAVIAFLVDSRANPKASELLVSVDVQSFNSKPYYVFTDGAGYGEAAYKFTFTGNELVTDAIASIGGIPSVGSKKHIWVARRHPGTCSGEQILAVDWESITKGGDATTNYQLLPGDRVYVQSERIFRTDSAIAKVLSPIERLFGVTLLGASTVNTIRAGGNNNNNNFGN